MNLSNSAKVGFFTLIAFIVLAVMITWKSNFLLVREGQGILGSFQNIEGLTIGSEVRYRGYTVGKVMELDPNPKDVRVYAVVKKGLVIPSDSKLRIGFDGLVGQKYLEIRPGRSTVAYAEGIPLVGISTAGIVDFVDIGAQNLVETKKILTVLRQLAEDDKLQAAFKNAIFTAEKVTLDVEKLANEIRSTNYGIMKITTDSDFQESVKGTMKETNRTLSSANNFFDSFSKVNLKPSADIQYGSSVNSVRGNIDIVQTPTDYLRIGIGEGPTRNLSLLDFQISRRVLSNLGMRLGMINTYLGGGIDFFMSNLVTLSGDLYDFNNPKPNVPKIRATADYKLYDYSDLFFQFDDIFNQQRNYSLGIKIKGAQ